MKKQHLRDGIVKRKAQSIGHILQELISWNKCLRILLELVIQSVRTTYYINLDMDLFQPFTCPICFRTYDEAEKKPLYICASHHTACEACFTRILQGQGVKKACPFCRVQLKKQSSQQFSALREFKMSVQKYETRFMEVEQQLHQEKKKNETMRALNILKRFQERELQLKDNECGYEIQEKITTTLINDNHRLLLNKIVDCMYQQSLCYNCQLN